jgi:hypothetical protein
MAVCERFIDLLDVVEDYDETDDILRDNKSCNYVIEIPNVISLQEALGPMNWSIPLSMELQSAVDTFNIQEVSALDFSVTLADPTVKDCPLVACSIGFTTLTGYTVEEIVGRNCRFMLNGVPDEFVDDEVRMMCRSFCQSAKHGKEYAGCSEVLPRGVSKCWYALPQGELVCIQVNAHKSGELFRNMFYLKQVELNDASYILALQAGIPDDCGDLSALDILQTKCYDVWQHLDKNMETIVSALSSQFWYHASMRRQRNCRPLDDILKA